MKTANLTGTALDWAVSQAAKVEVQIVDGGLINKSDGDWWQPSADWAQGGPIIERENIAVTGTNFPWWECDDGWYAYIGDCYSYGTTPLIAAMRRYVASKLGEEIELPAELMTHA